MTEASQFGAEVQLRRRDLRRGKQRARAERVPGGVRVTFTWGDPRAGQLEEQYLLTGPDEMAVRSRMTIGGQSVHTVQVRTQCTWRACLAYLMAEHVLGCRRCCACML